MGLGPCDTVEIAGHGGDGEVLFGEGFEGAAGEAVVDVCRELVFGCQCYSVSN